MNDILHQLLNRYPFSSDKLKTLVIGEKNVAVMLANGCIGVCSTLGKTINESGEKILSKPNLAKYEHRIVINAWVNACANYNEKSVGFSDISSAVNFPQNETVVIIGYFKSLVKKLEERNIKTTVFDLNEEDKPVEPMHKQLETIQKAENIILTATTIANSTLMGILPNIPSGCKVYILGPSTPLSSSILAEYPIDGLFGSRFEPFDLDVMSSIANGGGTRSFLGRMQKVWLKKNPS